MGTDVERIVVGFRTIHELWASIVEITIAVYLLKEQVYVACLVPGVIVLGRFDDVLQNEKDSQN